VLAAFQDAFVALVTEPRCDLGRFELEPHELAALRAIPAAELARYARSLIEKRWGELQRVVALTARVAPSLGDRYRRWAHENPARVREDVLSPGAAEALRALPSLRAALADEAEAAYASELYEFETLRAASRCDGVPRRLRAAHAIHAIADDIARGLVPIDPDRAAHEYVFGRDRVHWRRP
jgi:hypothetical protein